MKMTRRGFAGLFGALFAAPAAAKVAVEPEVPADPLYEGLWAGGNHSHSITTAAEPSHTHLVMGCHQHCTIDGTVHCYCEAGRRRWREAFWKEALRPNHFDPPTGV